MKIDVKLQYWFAKNLKENGNSLKALKLIKSARDISLEMYTDTSDKKWFEILKFCMTFLYKINPIKNI